ncbi:hypothetical protein MXB_2690 [Myxobolus squamalis]|nr:hypothetical protein MXB_2690 [Myxobolus squamalis]
MVLKGLKLIDLYQEYGVSSDRAIACADAGADLISPFVGRISDWFKNVKGLKIDHAESDPGVQSVLRIANYFKRFDIATVIMGASFRNIDQIKALCGIDALTIS